eukprot:Rmarinus@m.5935
MGSEDSIFTRGDPLSLISLEEDEAGLIDADPFLTNPSSTSANFLSQAPVIPENVPTLANGKKEKSKGRGKLVAKTIQGLKRRIIETDALIEKFKAKDQELRTTKAELQVLFMRKEGSGKLQELEEELKNRTQANNRLQERVATLTREISSLHATAHRREHDLRIANAKVEGLSLTKVNAARDVGVDARPDLCQREVQCRPQRLLDSSVQVDSIFEASPLVTSNQDVKESAEIAALQMKFHSLSEEHNSLHGKYDSVTEECKALRLQVSALEKTIVEKEQLKEDLALQMQHTRDHEHEAHLAQLRLSLKEQATCVQRGETENSSLRMELERYKDQVSKMECVIAEEKKKLDSSLDNQSMLSSELESHRLQAMTTEKSLAEEIQKLKESLCDQQSRGEQYRASKAESERWQQKAIAAEKALSNEREKLRKVEARCEHLQKSITDRDEVVARQQDSVVPQAEAAHEREALEKQLDSVIRERDAALEDKESITRAHQAALMQRDAARRELQVRQTTSVQEATMKEKTFEERRYRELEREVVDLRDELYETRANGDALRQKLRALRSFGEGLFNLLGREDDENPQCHRKRSYAPDSETVADTSFSKRRRISAYDRVDNRIARTVPSASERTFRAGPGPTFSSYLEDTRRDLGVPQMPNRSERTASHADTDMERNISQHERIHASSNHGHAAALLRTSSPERHGAEVVRTYSPERRGAEVVRTSSPERRGAEVVRTSSPERRGSKTKHVDQESLSSSGTVSESPDPSQVTVRNVQRLENAGLSLGSSQGSVHMSPPRRHFIQKVTSPLATGSVNSPSLPVMSLEHDTPLPSGPPSTSLKRRRLPTVRKSDKRLESRTTSSGLVKDMNVVTQDSSTSVEKSTPSDSCSVVSAVARVAEAVSGQEHSQPLIGRGLSTRAELNSNSLDPGSVITDAGRSASQSNDRRDPGKPLCTEAQTVSESLFQCITGTKQARSTTGGIDAVLRGATILESFLRTHAHSESDCEAVLLAAADAVVYVTMRLGLVADVWTRGTWAVCPGVVIAAILMKTASAASADAALTFLGDSGVQEMPPLIDRACRALSKFVVTLAGNIGMPLPADAVGRMRCRTEATRCISLLARAFNEPARVRVLLFDVLGRAPIAGTVDVLFNVWPEPFRALQNSLSVGTGASGVSALEGLGEDGVLCADLATMLKEAIEEHPGLS